MYGVMDKEAHGISCHLTLPNDKFFNWSKLKAFADDKINASQKLKYVLGRVENIMGKGENAGYQHFLLFPQCFPKPSFSVSLKVGIVWYRVKSEAGKISLKACRKWHVHVLSHPWNPGLSITLLSMHYPWVN